MTTPIVELKRTCLVTSLIDYSLRKTNVNDAIFASVISNDKAQTLMNKISTSTRKSMQNFFI